MPCPHCDSPLLVSEKYEDMRCPTCANLSTIPYSTLRPELEATRDHLSEDRLIELLKDYKKTQLILILIRESNKAAHEMYQRRRTQTREFLFASRLIKLLLPETGFGNKLFNIDNELPELIDTTFGHQSLIQRTLDHLEERFQYAHYKVGIKDASNFFGKFQRYESEFNYCFIRCLKSLMGGFPEEQELFDRAHDAFRGFDTPDSNNIESVREFAEIFFELIISFGFLFSSQESLNEVYQQPLPESVTILDLSDFIERIDLQYSGGPLNEIKETGELAVAEWPQVQSAGYEIFGDDWENVRDRILMHPGNTDAHPFLFGLPIKEKPVGHRLGTPVKIDVPKVFYPYHHSHLIRFQLFPLLHDETGTPGHRVLETVGDGRGQRYEWNVYEFLDEQDYHVYHSLVSLVGGEHEVDILVVDENAGELWFIECKYLMPAVRMDTPDGIRAFNDKVDSKVFPEDSEAFDEKVDWWLDHQPGEPFKSQTEWDTGDRVRQQFEEAWSNYEVKRFVVSNLVPSYTKKRGIVFMTDLEFLEFLETGETPYMPKREAWVPD